jgi:transposase
VGIDVSLKENSVCVVGARGAIIHEMKVASEPEALCDLIGGFGFSVNLIGLEAGPLSQ